MAALPKTMSGWIYYHCGGGHTALKLEEDLPVPAPEKGFLLVRVAATSVNPGDWKVQKGMLRPLLPRLPFAPGLDVAGEVVQVGSEVTRFQPGDAMFGMCDVFRGGGLSQFALVRESKAAICPRQLSVEHAAALPLAGMTALQGLRASGVTLPGSKEWTGEGSYKGHVLVANASGGVGHFAVQLAKFAGAHVTATVGTRNMSLAKHILGADEVLDYKTSEGKSLTPPSGKPFDVVFDCTEPDTYDWSVVGPRLSDNGVWMDIGPTGGNLFTSIWHGLWSKGKRIKTLVMAPHKDDLKVLGDLAVEEKLKVVVDSCLPFSKAPDAWEKSLEGHVTGKVVVKH